MTHGAPGVPVEVDATDRDGRFILSVDQWRRLPIPPDARAQLFQPFFRGAVRRSQQGLGLGLFIVNEIAKAHGGTVEVESTDEATQFSIFHAFATHQRRGFNRVKATLDATGRQGFDLAIIVTGIRPAAYFAINVWTSAGVTPSIRPSLPSASCSTRGSRAT